MKTKSLKTSIKYNKIILPAIQNIKYYFNKHIIKKRHRTMKIKGYNIKNPQTVNQTTVKRILESNLHPLKTHKFKHSEYFKEVEIAQQQGSDYVLAYKIYDMNFNQYYYICSYLESELNIKPNNDITIFRSRKYITTQDTQETTTDTETPKEYKTTLKQDIICIINTIAIIFIITALIYMFIL